MNSRVLPNRWPLLIGAVILLGVGLRVLKAWSLQYMASSDHTIVFLMAQHMAEGSHFPAFFYGQPYMGSVEPAVSALLFKLFGISSLNGCLGTALVSSLVLPLVYLWARDAGGRRAGLIALLLYLIGTTTSYHYSAAPRGGYAALMAFGVLTVYLACRIATRMKTGQKVPVWLYLLIGLSAGLGWWANQLVVGFLLAAALVLLAGFSWRLVREGAIPAALAFFVGSAPWWIWNATHNWATLDFGEALGKTPFNKGLVGYFDTILRVLDLAPPWNAARVMILSIVAALSLIFLIRFVRNSLRRREPDRFFFQLAIPAMLLAMAIVSIPSKYIAWGGNSRYLIPLTPVAAVVLGCGIEWLANWKPSRAWWLLVAILIAPQIRLLTPLRTYYEEGYAAWHQAKPFAESIRALGDGACHGNYDLHWMTFASGGQLCVVNLPWERLAKFARRVELSDRPVFLDNPCDLHSFLAYTGGTSRETNSFGIHVDYDLTPPPNDWRYLEAAAITEILDDKGRSCRDVITDNTLNSSWKAYLENSEQANLTFEFSGARALCGLRFVSLRACPPSLLKAEVQTPGSSVWKEVLPWTKPGGYFWSGPHLKLEGIQTYEEIRFPPPPEGVNKLRLTFGLPDSRARFILLDEVLLMEKASAPPAVMPSVQQCWTTVKANRIQQFFGPRWMTERLASQSDGSIAITTPAFLKRSMQALAIDDPNIAPEIVFKERTGLLMDARDAARSREVLRQCGHTWTESTLGSLVLLTVDPMTEANDWLHYTPVFWTEQGCFAQDTTRILKLRAERVFRLAMKQTEQGDLTNAVASLEKAVALYESHQPARKALIAALDRSGQKEQVAVQAKRLADQTVPATPAAVRFAGGIEFLGLSLSTNAVKPGQSFMVTYFWKCPPVVDTHALAAFVHFHQDRNRFQDDHVFLEEVYPENIRYQPFAEVFSYTRKVTVPAASPSGDYGLIIGLVERSNHKRLKADTSLPRKKKAVTLPVSLKVL